MKIVVFGAGNIGRSFVGQLFARAGYRVVFVDVDERLIEALNREGQYRIKVKDRTPAEIQVEGVSAVHAAERDRVAAELVECDIAATAVGPAALPHIYPVMAAGLKRRRQAGVGPLDIIICENLRDAAQAVAEGLRDQLPEDFPLEEWVGLVETSIGKMVPIMPEEARRRDPLLLYAEAYNTLILDGRAFRNPIPDVTGLDPKDNMAAYVDRKAFIHNCGHAACAYVGHLAHPEATYIWEVIEDPEVREAARLAMWESARALISRYPREFDESNQRAHIEDLLARFANRALGDTIYRVGRDLPRKLSHDDRLVGALLMDAAEGCEAPATTLAAAAGFLFRGRDEHGELFPADARFAEHLENQGVEWALSKVCGLRPSDDTEVRVRRGVTRAHAYLRGRAADWLERFITDPTAVLAAD